MQPLARWNSLHRSLAGAGASQDATPVATKVTEQGCMRSRMRIVETLYYRSVASRFMCIQNPVPI
jgi:hypothetical protein